MLLAILWASQANTVPATFWALAMLLLPENKGHAAAVLSELKEEVKEEEDKESTASPVTATATTKQQQVQASVSRAAFRLATDRKSAVSRCVAEAIRLRVHSIDLRIAAADISLGLSSGGQVSGQGGGDFDVP